MTGLIPFNMRYSALPSGVEEFCDILSEFGGLGDFFTDRRRLGRSGGRGTFKLDVEESPEAFEIQAELPGVKKDEIGLELNDGVLTISVKKEESAEGEKRNYLHKERRSVSMSRSVRLSEARAEGVKAKLEDGVLSITVEKEQKTNKAIAIEIQ